jgi:transposase
MQYIGIDVASKKLNIHITGRELSDFEIPNNIEALEEFVREHELNPEEYTIGAESTGKYHYIAQKYFVMNEFEFRLLNPITTNQFISATIRKKKTDKSDAQIITCLLLQGAGQVITRKQLETTKKSLLRTRTTVVKHRSSMKLLLKQLGKEESCARIEQAKISLLEMIEKMNETADELEGCALDEEPSNDERLIQSIPGFAEKLSAIVSAEVGDFNRFPSATQFKAYVGIDPKVTQSGDSHRTGKITKRGNTMLRHAFYIAANVARQYDPELKAFFEKKRSEGKHYTVAVCAVSRKLCERVYAVVTKGTPYEIRQVLVS